MRSPVLVYSSLVMTALCCFALWRGQEEFAVRDGLSQRIEFLSKKVAEEKLRTELVLSRFTDFKQDVALRLGDESQIKNQESLRDLASIIPHKLKETQNIEKSSKKFFDEGVSAYKSGEYDKAIEKFLGVTSQFPDSTVQLESSYYLVKSFYITGNKQEALSWSEKMLKMFPDSRWTARSMIVMAHIYVDQNRKNDALDVYQTILNTFKETDIQDEVKKQLVDMGL